MNEKETMLRLGSIHGIEIAAVKNDLGQIYVPIKPICEILGISFQGQHAKIKEDYSFSSTVKIILTVGADGKNREMVCLPVKHICGWLYSINPGKVSPESMKKLLDYREEVNDILTAYFFGGSIRQIESNQAEIKALEEINSLLTQERTIKGQLKEARDRLAKIRAARLDDQPSLFD